MAYTNYIANFNGTPGTPGIIQSTLATRPASALNGTLFVDRTTPGLQFYNGAAWVDLFNAAGFVPATRTLTIAGVAFDLSANRTWQALAPGGNTYGMNFKIGTDDNFTVAIKTNGVDRLTFNTAGTATLTTNLLNFTAGAAVNIGTTDAFALQFKTAGTTRLTLSASTGNATFTGAIFAESTVRFGKGGGAVASNTAGGAGALTVNTTGSSMTAFGNNAGGANITGTASSYFGADAGQFATATSATGVGRRALQVASGLSMTGVGAESLAGNSTGANCTAVGSAALNANNGSNVTALGSGAGAVNTGSNCLFLGSFAGGLSTAESNKLYIDVTNTSSPLIGGDFSARTLTFDASIKTQQPSANGADFWKLGKLLAGAVALDATQSLEVMVGGVLRKILIAA